VAIQGPDVEPHFPFPGWSLTYPEALPFPREPFAEALDEHLRLFETHKRGILDALREAATSEESHLSVCDLATIIETWKDKPDTVKIGSRGELATYIRANRGLVHPLFTRPIGSHTFVAIATKTVLSLHLAKVTGFETQRFDLVMVKREVAFEPTAIKNRAVEPLHVTRWRAPDGFRYAWTVAPTEPASEDDAIDRFIVRDGPKIRQAMVDFAASHPGKWPIAFAMCMREAGDGLEVLDRKSFASMAAQFPKIARAVAMTNDEALLPVVVVLGLCAGLRWLQLEKGDRALPPSIFEEADYPADEHAKPFFAPPEPEPEPPPPPKKDPARAMRYILEEQAVDDEIDVHLSQMTKEEIDADMKRAGFDPAVEHATRWIRHDVIEAMYELERDETRFWNEEGDFKTRPGKKVT